MGTVSNEQAVTEAAETLLKQIKASAQDTKHPPHLRELAEAFALVAGNDPKAPPSPVAPVRIR